jgi:N-acetylneuraminate synthase
MDIPMVRIGSFEFDVQQHVKTYCESVGLVYSTSVWDATSAKEIASLHPELLKNTVSQ